MPHLPGRGSLVQLFQMLLVLKRIHALPESGALVGQQSVFFNQALKWLPYQFFTRVDVLEDLIA